MASPKLRFKEFDGAWSKSSILDLSKEKALNNGVFNDQNKVGKGYKLINVLDMYIERDIDEARLSLLDLDAKEFERNKVKYGDIFFTRSSLVKEGIAFSNVYLGNANDVTYDGHLIKLSPDLERIDPIFLNFSLKTENVRKQLIQGGKTATMTTIGQKEVGSCQLDIPSKEEQTKIASFLSSVDEKISQLTQKHELLSQYKQGMMQKLFSQQIRFKADDGSEFGEWETKTLGEMGENIIGLTYSPTDVTTDGTGILVLRSSNIKNGRLDKDDQVRVNKSIKDRIIIQPNDILICTRNGSQRLIGKSVLINDTERMTFGAFMSVYRSPYNQFISYLMQTPWFFEQVQMNLGARINQITTGTLNEFTFDFPSLEEQTKIANFLSAIDQKIEVVAQQIEQAKEWKKGLLQQMFV
ncbi:restriction endonuclease subunit S [Acinetobacter baumannii]|uniref:restriction endonuclease subunit S n=1 Tax=Acinetobacter baumannii TaxID=470 RepID=UPI002340E927|nr:restriction endonuclease subunit S [Acinetobacter baumannii]